MSVSYRMSPEQALLHMGLKEFRGRQSDIVGSILSGRDTMVLMATAGGKSLCYTVPALCLEGYAIVISPLIALMDDQKASMESRGVRAAIFRGGQGHDERSEIMGNAVAGRIQVILMPPELLATPSVASMIAQTPPSFVAFDEAHCISTWGQDFRPDYAEVGSVLDEIGNAAGERIQRVALTATASSRTVGDILRLAHMPDPEIISSPLVRENLAIFVNHASSQAAIDAAMIKDITYFGSSSGIVYCRTRKECERTAAMLSEAGLRCVAHHSGMPVRSRQDAAQSFMRGTIPVMVATIGFGMGIDKADVRYVIHNGISPTPEAWYQEIGRGGRDGGHATAITYAMPLSTAIIRAGSSRREDGWGAGMDYADVLYGNGCRMQAVMTCFGEDAPPCGHCDNCLGVHRDNAPALFDSELISSVRDNQGQSPGHYARQIADKEMKTDVLTSMDAMFVAGLIDFDIIFRDGGPPTPRVVMTAEGLSCRSPALEVPALLSEAVVGKSIEDVCGLILGRTAYNGLDFNRSHAQMICNIRPGRETIRAMSGLNLPDHLLQALAPHDKPNRPERVQDRIVQRFRL